MIGVVVVTHSSLAQALLTAAEMIIGPAPLTAAVSIDRGVSPEEARERLRQALDEVGADGEGALILTDLFGGTPTNISAEFLREDQVEILTGVNLPMLLKCLGARRGTGVADLAALLKDYARNAVLRPAELLRTAAKH